LGHCIAQVFLRDASNVGSYGVVRWNGGFLGDVPDVIRIEENIALVSGILAVVMAYRARWEPGVQVRRNDGEDTAD
jgi:hypothetical protein